jgi:small subunit ribosomal protein S8e
VISFRYESHYALPLGRKKGAKLTEVEEKALHVKRSNKTEKKYKERQKDSKVEQGLQDQFMTGKMFLEEDDNRSRCEFSMKEK